MSAASLFAMRPDADPRAAQGFAALTIKTAADALRAAVDSGEGMTADQCWSLLSSVELALAATSRPAATEQGSAERDRCRDLLELQAGLLHDARNFALQQGVLWAGVRRELSGGGEGWEFTDAALLAAVGEEAADVFQTSCGNRKRDAEAMLARGGA